MSKMADLRLYNTLTRKKEEFVPLKKGKVGIYSCGPTVYWNQHIGHIYAYVQWDTLVRFFRYLGYKVKWVMNITDVGHLTSDEDAGEDKMEKGARREGLTVWQIADKYIAQFLESLELLNIQKPDVLPRATEHIKEQIDLIKKIEKNGFTYKTKTGLVFDTSKFADYAKFSRLDLAKQQAGARVEVDPEKKQPWDFLLWVTNQPEHVMLWDSPWGRGFPGWHIECTAMSTKYLGEKFDIHTGGKEHIPVHHTNEIGQGFGAFGGQTANFWLHNDWLVVKGKKMSKSLGNMYLVTDLVEKGYDPLALRYLILTSHYRSGLNFTWKGLEGAQKALNKLYQVAHELLVPIPDNFSEKDLPKEAKVWEKKFIEAINNDLNIPQAVAVVWAMVKSDLGNEQKYQLLFLWDKVLGLRLAPDRILRMKEPWVEPAEVKELVKRREKLRKEDKWKEADEIRKKLKKMGYVIEDTSQGPRVKKTRRDYER